MSTRINTVYAGLPVLAVSGICSLRSGNTAFKVWLRLNCSSAGL